MELSPIQHAKHEFRIQLDEEESLALMATYREKLVREVSKEEEPDEFTLYVAEQEEGKAISFYASSRSTVSEELARFYRERFVATMRIQLETQTPNYLNPDLSARIRLGNVAIKLAVDIDNAVMAYNQSVDAIDREVEKFSTEIDAEYGVTEKDEQ